MSDDLFIANTHHTAVPDWVALRTDIPIQARNLAHVILVKCRGPLMPTVDDLAALLDVNTRTIERWLEQLRSAGVLRTYRAGRRRMFTLTDSDSAQYMADRSVIHGIGDPATITDHMCHVLNAKPGQSLCQPDAENSAFSTKPIGDPAVGVVGDHDSFEKEKPTTTQRRPLKTELARWMKRFGINAARQFDDPALDYWTYRRFCEDARARGMDFRQLVTTLREAPLERDPFAAPLEERAEDADLVALADELADDPEQPAVGRPIEDVIAGFERRRRRPAGSSTAPAPAGAGQEVKR